MKRLENKVAIITGGAQGIGKAAVKKFAEEGATVIIWDVNSEKASSTINEFKDVSKKIEFQKVDVTNLDSVTNAAAEIVEKHTKISILINNAGITRDASFLKMTSDQWKAVVPIMVENKFGRIVNTSSVVGLYGNFGQTNYAATKSGIIGMTKVWAKELGRKGINVNAVAPGFIATEMIETVPEKVIDMLKEKTPLGKLGDPEDIANAYLFLVSDEARYITGTVLSVDGGLVL
jgi:3-oxoacyl-[acyl-carrier protein] reductase